MPAFQAKPSDAVVQCLSYLLVLFAAVGLTTLNLLWVLKCDEMSNHGVITDEHRCLNGGTVMYTRLPPACSLHIEALDVRGK